MNVLSFSSGKNLKEGLATLEEDLVKLTVELQMEAQCIPNMTHPHAPIGGEDRSTVRAMVYSIKDSDQCLIGTAEIPVGGIHMDAILAESLLPLIEVWAAEGALDVTIIGDDIRLHQVINFQQAASTRLQNGRAWS
ncbi:hypothetical protein POTOM_021484 [Populus tomentosa]|uniref:Uncharacterized protein n=1 Tax=Populus tomentosa TaxID=118781 RepID=A0A8X7ZS04_POPTO|nr:hypothetical protein POTOM_021484 [Populus tomentosa]